MVVPKGILHCTPSRLQCWWKIKKININILMAWAPSASPLATPLKATWAISFLMLLAYCNKIIQNPRKTVVIAVATNVCWRKSSCELFPLVTTHVKGANSGSGKIVIARYPIGYFFKNRRYRQRYWKINLLQQLAILEAHYCPALKITGQKFRLTPGYTNLLNSTFHNGVGGRASGLQTHS